MVLKNLYRVDAILKDNTRVAESFLASSIGEARKIATNLWVQPVKKIESILLIIRDYEGWQNAGFPKNWNK